MTGDRGVFLICVIFWWIYSPAFEMGWGKTFLAEVTGDSLLHHRKCAASAVYIQTFRLFLQKFMTCKHHSGHKSRSFTFVLVRHCIIFHASNSISQNLISSTHLSFLNKSHIHIVWCFMQCVGLAGCEDWKGKVNIPTWGHTIVQICKFITRTLW